MNLSSENPASINTPSGPIGIGRKAVSWMRIIVELAKVRVTLAVTASTAAGYVLFAERFAAPMLLPMAGVFLLACGCSALNQIQEARIDALMPRTCNRPIPSGRIDPCVAMFIAGLLMLLGLFLLSSVERHIFTILLLAGIATVWYNVVYTYLKRATPFAVVIGALVGAIPPLIGWSSAGGALADPLILLVASFFFIWQIPHFWLLLLMRGREYEQAGFASPTKAFTQPQLFRITFMWILAAAAAGLLIAILSQMDLFWKLAMFVCSIWLVFKALPFVNVDPSQAPSHLRRAFFQLILYALLVVTILCLQAVV
jgi:protoheme IX farnesyltransferase